MGYSLVPAVCPALAEPAPPLAKALAELAPPLAKAWLGLPQAMDVWRTDIRKFAPMVLCFPIAPRCVLWRWRQMEHELLVATGVSAVVMVVAVEMVVVKQ